MTEFNAIPNEPHYAILETVTVTTPGDERSRTHPGHGYPASRDTYITYSAIMDRQVWEERIKELTLCKVAFKAMRVNPASIAIQVNVKTNTITHREIGGLRG
jgi:hypothetical protein